LLVMCGTCTHGCQELTGTFAVGWKDMQLDDVVD
jgi:hypothetical protein